MTKEAVVLPFETIFIVFGRFLNGTNKLKTSIRSFDVLLTVHLSIILVINRFNAQIYSNHIREIHT